jgi:hypothetical protein
VPATMQGHSLLRPDRPTESFFQVSESEVGRGIRTTGRSTTPSHRTPTRGRP